MRTIKVTLTCPKTNHTWETELTTDVKLAALIRAVSATLDEFAEEE